MVDEFENLRLSGVGLDSTEKCEVVGAHRVSAQSALTLTLTTRTLMPCCAASP